MLTLGKKEQHCPSLLLGLGRQNKYRLLLLYAILIVCLCLFWTGELQRLYALHACVGDSTARHEPSAPPPSASPLSPETVARVLRLNADLAPECPRVFFLRTPKTGSSALSSLFFAKKDLAGAHCNARLFRLRELRNDTYTVSAEVLEGLAPGALERYSMFVAHMNYSTRLRARLRLGGLYRVSAVRAGLARLESHMAYEAGRPDVGLAPALEYLSHAHTELFERRARLSDADLAAAVEGVLRDFHLVIVAEFLDRSLAVLMHDLRWRAVDVVAPRINAMHGGARARALCQARRSKLAEDDGPARLRWALKVDRVLYARCTAELRRKFRALPSAYREVPPVLQHLRRGMEKECQTQPTKKHFSARDKECIRRYREQITSQATGTRLLPRAVDA